MKHTYPTISNNSAAHPVYPRFFGRVLLLSSSSKFLGSNAEAIENIEVVLLGWFAVGNSCYEGSERDRMEVRIGHKLGCLVVGDSFSRPGEVPFLFFY